LNPSKHPFLCSDGGAIAHILLFVPEYEAEHFAVVYGALIGSRFGESQTASKDQNR